MFSGRSRLKLEPNFAILLGQGRLSQGGGWERNLFILLPLDRRGYRLITTRSAARLFKLNWLRCTSNTAITRPGRLGEGGDCSDVGGVDLPTIVGGLDATVLGVVVSVRSHD